MTKTTILTPIALACLAVVARAQSAVNKDEMRRSILEETIVTATRSDETVMDAPYTAEVVESRDITERLQARTFPDALREIPGVMVQKTTYGQASPFIRGFTGFRTLALIDGIRLNNATFREGPNQYWSTVDQYTIDRIEVVKGPASVLYGSDAIGGTVNAITKRPSLITSEPELSNGKTAPQNVTLSGPQIRTTTHYRYATAENSHTMRGEFDAALSPRLGVAGGLTYKDFDDLRGGSVIGTQDKTGYDEIDGDFRLLWTPTDDVDVRLGYFHVEQNNVPRWHSTIYSKSFDGTSLGSDLKRDYDQYRDLAYAQVEVRDVADWLSKVNLSLSFQRQSEEQDRIRSDGRRDIDGFQDDQYGFLASFESPSAIGTLTYGVEYYHDEVQSWGSRWNPDGSLRNIKQRGPVADDASYDLLGFFVQDEIKVGERLTIIPGARWTLAHVDTGVIDPDPTDSFDIDGFDEDFDAFTFSLRAKYDVTKGWNFFTGLSQGFRAPNLSDFTSFDVARSGEREVPVTSLDPEQYLSFEIGTKVSLPEHGLDFYAAYYRTWIDDQIIRYPNGGMIDGEPTVERANSGDGYVQGVEAGLSWEFVDGWTLFGNFAWSEGEVGQYLGNGIGVFPVSRIHPMIGQFGLHWESPQGKWWAEGLVTLAASQNRLSLGDAGDTERIPPGGTHGYQVFTVRGGWRPCENVDIFAACENLTNEDYRIHGSGTNEPGTNFVIGTKITF